MSGKERFSREAAAGLDRQVIEDSNVIVVGAGALGNFIMLALALLGFPRVTCVDMDRFEDSNAPRSPFYQRGRLKARAVAAGARRLCTATENVVYRYASVMVQALGDDLFKGAGRTIVLSAVDCPQARRWLAERCRKTGIPLIEGGFHSGRWNASVILNQAEAEPCWACGQGPLGTRRLFSCETYARQVEAAGLVPAAAPVAMQLAAFMVEAMTQLLHGDLTLANRTLFAELTRGVVQSMQRVADPSCPIDHRVVAHQAKPMHCGPQDTVCSLLEELAGQVSDPIVRLPAAFIAVAPCGQCHSTTLVRQPAWRLAKTPLCRECGGSFKRTPRVAEQHGTLSEPTSRSIFPWRLEAIGLGPGLHLEVDGRDRSLTIALAGGADLLTVVGRKVMPETVS